MLCAHVSFETSPSLYLGAVSCIVQASCIRNSLYICIINYVYSPSEWVSQLCQCLQPTHTLTWNWTQKCLPMTACLVENQYFCRCVCVRRLYCFARGRIPFLKHTSNNKPALAFPSKTRTRSFGRDQIQLVLPLRRSRISEFGEGVLNFN